MIRWSLRRNDVVTWFWRNIDVIITLHVRWVHISWDVPHIQHQNLDSRASIMLPTSTLRWRRNGCDSVSHHQPHDCLLNRLFGRRSKKTSKLRVTGLCVGNSPATGEFPAQMASNAENVSIWWRHHVSKGTIINNHIYRWLTLITSTEKKFAWSLPLLSKVSDRRKTFHVATFCMAKVSGIAGDINVYAPWLCIIQQVLRPLHSHTRVAAGLSVEYETWIVSPFCDWLA